MTNQINHKGDQIKKLLAFLGPRAMKIWEREMEDSHPIFLPFEIADNWEKHRKNKEVVELFYDALEFMNVEVPDHLRVEELDWELFLRIMDHHLPKSASFVKLAKELELHQDSLKKMLGRVDPEFAMELRKRKKLSFQEYYKVGKSLGTHEELILDEEEENILFDFIIIPRLVMYRALNTDKKTLDSNLSEALKQIISGLDLIPPVLYKEIRDELNGH